MRNVQSLKLHMIIVVLLFFLGTFLRLNAQVWVPVSDYSTINSTDKYLLVDMLSGKAVGVQGSSTLTTSVETLNMQKSGVIVNDELIQDNIKWSFTKVSDGCYNISCYKGKNYKLYRDGSNLCVSRTPNSNVKWQIDYKKDEYTGFLERASSWFVLCLFRDVWKMYSNTSTALASHPTHMVVYEFSEVIPPVASCYSGLYYEPFDVTLSAEEGYSIHYTVDGTEPTVASPEYTEPIHITGQTTLKAIAVNGDAVSKVYVAEYKFGETMENIASFKQLQDGDEARLLLKDAYVIGADADNYYVQDATGGIVISRTENNWAVNDILNGVVKGKFDNSNGLPKLKPADCQVEVSSDGGNIQPAGLTIDDLITDPQKYLCTLVKLDEVSYDGKGYIVSENTENKIAFYDKFNVTDQAVWPSLVDITGILFIEGDVPQIAIRSWKDVEDATNLVAPDFFWSSSFYTADFALPEMAAYPILTNSSDGNLTFVSSDTGVATVSSTGEIKLTGTGTTVITATVSETKNYTMATASYELTVISSLATQRVAFVSISTFDNKTYALSNVSTGSGKLKAVPVRLFNGKVLCTSDVDKISWYIEGDNTVIRSASGQYLTYSATTSLRMSDNAYLWNHTSKNGDWYWAPNDDSERGIAYSTETGTDGFFGAYGLAYRTKSEAKLLVEGYVRTATSGKFGTMCLPYGVEATDMSGAVFYEIAGKKVDDNGLPVQLVLSPVEYLQAGKPYLFKAEADEIVLAYSGEPASVAIGWNGLIGSFDGVGAEASAILEDKYLLSNNKIVKCGKGCTLGTNRAYIDIEQVPVIDYSGVNMLTIQISTPTAVNDVHGMSQTRADIYNILGQKIYDQVDINDVANKLPSGIYVINGKKVILNK